MIAILVLLNAAKSMLLSQPSIKSPEHCEQRFPNCFKTPPRPPTEGFSPRTTKTILQKAGSKNPPVPKKKRAHTSATRYFVPALDRPRRQNRTRLSQHDALNTHPHCLTLAEIPTRTTAIPPPSTRHGMTLFLLKS